ncbi:MAG TPA: hypothetical protein VMB25_20565 [Bryobacteraceae bacterium]|nr:hypothetical protein [Bryobacteraceae bacterium]
MKIKLLLATVLAGTGLLAADINPQPTPGVPVQMVVTVEAVHGKAVPVIYQQDVKVMQNRQRLPVTDWVPLTGDQAGLELYVVLDDSSSSFLGTYLDELRHFITSQPATTEIGVGYMRNGTVAMGQDLTTDHALAAKALRLPLSEASVNGSPYISLSDLVRHWPADAKRHQVLMVTDGIDRLGGTSIIDPYLDNAIDDALRSGVMVYTLYTPGAGHYGHSNWLIFQGQNCLSKLAEETGGEAYMLGFGPVPSFTPYLAALSDRLEHQYRLTFLAKPQAKAGFQNVKLSTEVPNAELVAPSRVYVPADR